MTEQRGREVIQRPLGDGQARQRRRILPSREQFTRFMVNLTHGAIDLGRRNASNIATNVDAPPELHGVIKHAADAGHAMVNLEPTPQVSTGATLGEEFAQALASGQVKVTEYLAIRNDPHYQQDIPGIPDAPIVQIANGVLENRFYKVRPGFLGLRVIKAWWKERHGKGPKHMLNEAKRLLGDAAEQRAINIAIAEANADHASIYTPPNRHAVIKAGGGFFARHLFQPAYRLLQAAALSPINIIKWSAQLVLLFLKLLGINRKTIEANVRNAFGTQVAMVSGESTGAQILHATDYGTKAIGTALGLIEQAANYTRIIINTEQGPTQLEQKDLRLMGQEVQPLPLANSLILNRTHLPSDSSQRVEELLQAATFHAQRRFAAESRATN